MTALLRTDEAMLEGKIDALIEAEDGSLHILDYKTGRPSHESGSTHRFQVGLYCAAVAALGAGPIASARVVYLAPTGPDARALQPAEAAAEAMQAAQAAIEGIRAGRFDASVGPRCAHCPLGWACRKGR